MSVAFPMACPTCDGTGKIYRENASFGLLVATRRKQLGMTQQQLADKTKISRAAIANIESNRSETTLKNLRSFADALGMPIEELVP